MEMHHKLRRDPNWHPSACNICGQMGHQAAQCSNGTINWRQLYGDEAFRLKQPLYESDLLKLRSKKQVNLEDLEKRAKAYAAGQLNPELAAPDQQVQGTTFQANGTALKADPGVAGPLKPDLPAGWAVAKDGEGRAYYWHTKTKKTTWDKPTEETPIDP